jgi:4-hydroxy 2-oxovalerate aldolase
MTGNIQLLDCTLRDGGLGLEDAKKNNLSDVVFNNTDIDELSIKLQSSNIDIIELGSIEISESDKQNMAIYQNLESISIKIPKARSSKQMYAALYRGPDTAISNIPNWNKSYCEIIRVILRYSELKKSLDFCGEISKKGYKVILQPMVTMRYSQDEIRSVIDAANDMGAYALYFVDSYGYMREKDIRHFFSYYDKRLDASVKIGFHAHNNMNLAFSNALTFISQNSDRRIIIDSCLLGMGQGAGNLQTEIITDHMNKYYGASYDYDSVLEGCEIIVKYWNQSLWGYSVTRLLPAINNTAYKFSIALREKYGLSFVEINHILKNMPEELRHRYTKENVIQLLKMFKYGEAD